MKKIHLIVFLTIVSAILKANVFDGQFASGAGTSANPYRITSHIHLSNLAQIVNENPGISEGIYFRLENNIEENINRTVASPVGDTEVTAFEGIFDGNGYVISNFWQLQRGHNASSVAGLFGYTRGAIISDLTIESGRVFNENASYGGVLIGHATETTVRNCFVREVEITVHGEATGGLIGYAQTVTILRSAAEKALVTGANNVGGFIGIIDENGNNSSIRLCFSSCNVSGVKNVGGFAGYITSLQNSGVEITDSYATGQVFGLADGVGGFIGVCDNAETAISNCFATGSVFGASDEVGGFIGINIESSIERCFASGTVVGDINVGGFAGISYSDISNCFAVGTVDGKTLAGGFVGSNYGNISKCFAAGAVINNILYGAFIGSQYNPSAVITDCYFDNQTTGLNNARSLGDLAGVASFNADTRSFPQGFSSSDWVFMYGYYPQLRVFAASENEAVKAWCALAAVIFKPANNTELCSNLQTVAPLSSLTPENRVISWTANEAEGVTVLNNVVFAQASNTWRTLTLRAENMERAVMFRSFSGMTTAEILNVTVNQTTCEKTDNGFICYINCGEPDVTVLAEITHSPYAICEPGTPIRFEVNKPQTVIVETLDGEKSTLYNIVVKKSLPADIYLQRWHDVLTINNNYATNGGHNFTHYQWFENGAPLPDNKGYIQLTGAATYTAIVTSQHGEFEVCPIEIPEIVPKAAIYPNPVHRGQTVNVALNVSTAEPIVAVMQIFNQTGKLFSKQTLHSAVAEIAMPETSGTYIMQITANGMVETFKIVVE